MSQLRITLKSTKGEAYFDTTIDSHSQSRTSATEVVAHTADEAKAPFMAGDAPRSRRVVLVVDELGE